MTMGVTNSDLETRDTSSPFLDRNPSLSTSVGLQNDKIKSESQLRKLKVDLGVETGSSSTTKVQSSETPQEVPFKSERNMRVRRDEDEKDETTQ